MFMFCLYILVFTNFYSASLGVFHFGGFLRSVCYILIDETVRRDTRILIALKVGF